MRERLVVLGGGITGRLVKFLFPAAVVLEKSHAGAAQALTRMFGTNYLWEPLEGIPTRPFKVITHVDGLPGTHQSIRRYKVKIGKPEDIGNWGLQFEPEVTGYDFVTVPSPEGITFGARITRVNLDRQVVQYLDEKTGKRHSVRYDILFSTIPLNLFASLSRAETHWPVSKMFQFQPIYVYVAKVGGLVVEGLCLDSPLGNSTDMYVNYLSNPLFPVYRYCVRDHLVHAEFLDAPPKVPVVYISPGKIRNHPAVEGLLEALREKNVWTFGRFASWEPNELVHQTYKNLLNWRTSHGT